jgi:hypothetical protein
MKFQIPVLLVLGLFSFTALADVKPLFLIRKPDNPQNMVQTFVNVDANCKIGGVDFVWLRFTPESGYALNPLFTKFYQQRAYVKTPNSILHCQVMKRLRATAVPANSKASCNVLPKTVVCDQKGLTANELNKVNGAPPIIVRSVKSASTGQCSVAAFMDLGGNVVQIKKVNADGSVSNGFASKTVRFTSISVEAAAGQSPPPWACVRDCVETFGLEMLSCN